MQPCIVELSGWGIVQVAPYGLPPPPPVMHFLRVLIQDIHNLPLLFVFPEVCGWQRWLKTPGDSEGGRGNERAETRPKDSLLHSLECKEDREYGTFIGTLQNDNCQSQYNDVGCGVLGSNGILKEVRR